MTNVLNETTLTVNKQSSGTENVTGEVKFRVFFKLADTDNVTKNIVKTRTGKDVKQVYQLDGCSNGNVWNGITFDGAWYCIDYEYTMSAAAGLEIEGLPLKDANGNLITYRVVETSAPDGYYVTMLRNGVISDTEHVWADSQPNEDETELTATLVDHPKGTVTVGKRLQQVWDWVVGNPKGSETALEGVTLTIYHVNSETGKLDAVIGSAKTDADGEASFDAFKLDASEKYVVIETDSTAADGVTYDSRITADESTESRSGYYTSSVTTPATVNEPIGMTVAECEAKYGASEGGQSIVHEVSWEYTGGSENLYQDKSAILYNYDPYVQLTFEKEGQTITWTDGGKSEVKSITDAKPLAHVQFAVYTMSADDYAAATADGSTADLSTLDGLKAAGATTDGKIYETGSDGSFVTGTLDYSDGNVYFFYETSPALWCTAGDSQVKTPDGADTLYGAKASTVKTVDADGNVVSGGELGYKQTRVVGPITASLYESAKDNVYKYDAEILNTCNTWSGGSGDYLYRFVQIVVDKYADKNGNRQVDQDTDLKLANVTFRASLADKSGNVVTDSEGEPVFSTTFTTGEESASMPQRGSSTYLNITSLLANYSSCFTFLYWRQVDGVWTLCETKEDGSAYTYKDYTEANSVSNPDGLAKHNFELKCNFHLEELSYPDNSTPYERGGWTITVDTSVGHNAPTYTAYPVNTQYTGENAILNNYGSHVMATIQKLDSATGEAWVPMDEDDYVEYTFTTEESLTGVEEPISKAVVRLYKSKALISYNDEDFVSAEGYSYSNLPIVELSPEVKYTVYESHMPKGYDRPVNNKLEFTSYALKTRWNNEVQALTMSDAPYVSITVKKIDAEGNPVSGKDLRILYSYDSYTATTTINTDWAVQDANSKAWTANSGEGDDGHIVLTGTTGEDGTVTFVVPKYDYRKVEVSATEAAVPLATYRVIELNEKGEEDPGFSLMNRNKVGIISASGDLSSPILVSNPTTTSITVKKVSGVDGAPVEGVTIGLAWIPFTSGNSGTMNRLSYYVLQKAVQTLHPAAASYANYTKMTTDKNGEVTFEGLYSGYYRIIEDIPDGFMMSGAGSTTGNDLDYRTQFILITPEDAKELTQLYGSNDYYWQGSEQYVYIVAGNITGKNDDFGKDHGYKKIENEGPNSIETTYSAESGLGLTLTNTPKARLDIVKTVEANMTQKQSSAEAADAGSKDRSEV